LDAIIHLICAQISPLPENYNYAEASLSQVGMGVRLPACWRPPPLLGERRGGGQAAGLPQSCCILLTQALLQN